MILIYKKCKCISLHISQPSDLCLCMFTLHDVNVFALLRLSVSTIVIFHAISNLYMCLLEQSITVDKIVYL